MCSHTQKTRLMGKEDYAMQLELNEKERDILVLELENVIPELRGEIASGVKHDWKVELKKEEEILKVLLERLKTIH